MTQAMTNTYWMNVTKQQEFSVEDDLIEMGLNPWVPRALTMKNVKERKSPVWYDKPYVPKLVFCVIPAIYYTDVKKLKHVIGNPMPLSRRDIDGCPAYIKPDSGKPCPEVPGLVAFKKAVEAEYKDMERRRKNNEYQCLYRPGQALEILSGPFEGFTAEFKKTIKAAHDEFANLRVEVDIFGRATRLDVSPDMVTHQG